MGFVPGFEFDVFVSYAHADDVSDSSADTGWVAQLVRRLKAGLRQRLGGSEPNVFFDSSHLRSNQKLEELLAASRSSAVFVAVVSRSYVEREWTRRELDAFLGTNGDERRLFCAECLPLDDGEDYSPPLRGRKRMEFWYRDEPNSRTPIPLSPISDAQRFNQRVHDLAEHIRHELVGLKNASSLASIATVAARHGTPASGGQVRTVLLAQTTEDLAEEREDVRRHLEQFGVRLLPAGDYPQGGDAFRAAFRTDLASADMFVQLLGPLTGRMPPDVPEGYARAQLALAQAAGVPIMQWRHPDLDPAKVSNSEQVRLLDGEHVTAIGLEAFKSEVLQRLRPSPEGKKSTVPFVFIDANQNDLPLAKALKTEFARHEVMAALPVLAGPAEEVREDLEQSLIECHALLLVYGEASPLWVRAQLRLFNKLRPRRPEPPRVLAIFTGPPSEKPEIDFDVPGARSIDCRLGLNLNCLHDIMDALH